MNESLKRNLVAYAHSLGFERVGITSVAPLDKEEDFLKNWLSKGRAGEMAYLAREPERRAQPEKLLPGARSVIALAMSYGTDGAPSDGRIARYAWGGDYHKVINKRLQSFVRYLEALSSGVQCRTYVDTGPLLERALAQRAGLGFIGKNTMLITKGLGSWVFLANVITTLDLPLDAPDERRCGECRLCIDACPTEAITAPFELDARRCIAYLTIEKDGSLDAELRGKMEGWIFGCDICQEVCPHNAGARHPRRSQAGDPWIPHQKLWGMTSLNQILLIKDEAEFSEMFAGTAMMRAGREGLVRNACVAAANLDRKDLIPRLQKLAGNDSSPIVREQAAWALETLHAKDVSDAPPASIRNPVRS
jgi:epoxyqueuosine reductase